MQRLKLVLFLAEKCQGCEFIQSKMGNTISKFLDSAPNINFTEIICDNSVESARLQQAFRSEADGVLILSCRPEDCLDKMMSRLTSPDKDLLTEFLPEEEISKDAGLLKAGGAKWTSSN
jgi:coenzyme F420-reducing hydrogenase delta subunit